MRLEDFPKDFHLDTCTCDLEKIKETKLAAVKRVAPYYVDKDGNQLFYIDSFGWRGPYPGESQECYKALVEKMKGN